MRTRADVDVDRVGSRMEFLLEVVGKQELDDEKFNVLRVKRNKYNILKEIGSVQNAPPCLA